MAITKCAMYNPIQISWRAAFWTGRTSFPTNSGTCLLVDRPLAYTRPSLLVDRPLACTRPSLLVDRPLACTRPSRLVDRPLACTRPSLLVDRPLACTRPSAYVCCHYSCCFLVNLVTLLVSTRRSQWPRGLWGGSAAACLVGLRVRIPPGAWLCVSGERCVLCR
jgi:hypothetical protein